jgi:hypothetical protein
MPKFKTSMGENTSLAAANGLVYLGAGRCLYAVKELQP